MPHRLTGRALPLMRLGAAVALAVGVAGGCGAQRQPATAAGHTTATRGVAAPVTFPVTVTTVPSTTVPSTTVPSTAVPTTAVIGVVLAAPPGVITDDAQTVLEQLDEAMGELMIDFTDAPASSASATCQVFGIQPHTDQYAVAATVTNTDGVVSTYRLAYELFGPEGESLGTDFSVVSAVAPGTTVRDDTLGYLSDPVPWDQVSCTVIQVLRLPVVDG